MKKIAAHVNTYCTYCKAGGAEKVKAVWRLSYDTTHRACQAHKDELEAQEAQNRKFDGHYSEADYQTWMRT